MVSVNICLFPCWSFTATSARNKHFKEILYSIRHINLLVSNKCISSELGCHFQASFQNQRKLLPITDLHIQIFGMIEYMFRIFIPRSHEILLPAIVCKHTISDMAFESQPSFCSRYNGIFRNADTNLRDWTSITRKCQSPTT